jgi:DNA-binding GntR family transcriptional regulator
VAISGLPKVYTVSVFKGYDAHMHAVDPASNLSASPSNATNTIVEALTKAIVEHRLHPGTKLAEQKLADHFGVSRTLVRQALFQLSQNRLIRLEPARGAFVAAPSALEAHVAQEKSAIAGGDAAGRTELLGDFHVCMAELMGNDVLAQVLGDLISRCALITLMYQTASAAEHSIDEHVAIVKALAAKDEKLAVQLMDEHLLSVEESLAFNRKVPTNDISMALS